MKNVYYPDILNYLEKNVEVEEEEEEEEEVLLFFFSKQSIKHFEVFGLVVVLVKINILKIVYYNVLELLFFASRTMIGIFKQVETQNRVRESVFFVCLTCLVAYYRV